MKKVAVVLMLLAAITATAQRGDHHSRNGMKDLTPEQIATIKSKKATLALDLSQVQQKQIKALLLENIKLHRAKMDQRKTQKENGESKELTSEERYTKTNERLDHQIAQKAKLKNILSEDQLMKWEKMHHRKRMHHKGNGKQKGFKGKKTRR